jgi:hypothetical protein
VHPYLQLTLFVSRPEKEADSGGGGGGGGGKAAAIDMGSRPSGADIITIRSVRVGHVLFSGDGGKTAAIDIGSRPSGADIITIRSIRVRHVLFSGGSGGKTAAIYTVYRQPARWCGHHNDQVIRGTTCFVLQWWRWRKDGRH